MFLTFDGVNLLNKVSSYCKKWNIFVKTDKTKVMLLNPSNRPLLFEIHYERTQLEIVDSNYMEGPESATINNAGYPKHQEEEDISPNRNRIITSNR